MYSFTASEPGSVPDFQWLAHASFVIRPSKPNRVLQEVTSAAKSGMPARKRSKTSCKRSTASSALLKFCALDLEQWHEVSVVEFGL